MATGETKLAVVTGASTGIGYELAKSAADHGFDVLIAANEPEIHDAAASLRGSGKNRRGNRGRPVRPPKVSTSFALPAEGRPVDALLANAGRGLGTRIPRSRFRRSALRDRHQRHGHSLSDPQDRQRHARRNDGQDPDHRLDCGLHSWHAFRRSTTVPRRS